MFRLTGLAIAVLLFSTLSSSRSVSAENSSKKSKDANQEARFAIIRYVDGEYAKVVQPLPSEKHGFRYKVGQQIDVNKLHSALAYGSAANPGDQVQITDIEFHAKEIVVSINGGTKEHFDWRKHIHIGMGGAPVTATSTTPANQSATRIGAELVLDFEQGVPKQLTPDQLKQDLSPFLDFSNQRSAAVNWIDTLPPQFQQGIKNHSAVVGMNHEMVLAALGRPDQKIRETDDDGHETEDWIYGHPPEKTTLVTFLGDKVIRIKSYG